MASSMQLQPLPATTSSLPSPSCRGRKRKATPHPAPTTATSGVADALLAAAVDLHMHDTYLETSAELAELVSATTGARSDVSSPRGPTDSEVDPASPGPRDPAPATGSALLPGSANDAHAASTGTTGVSVQCQLCPARFDSRWSAEKHARLHAEYAPRLPPFVCLVDGCSTRFHSAARRLRQLREDHADFKPEPDAIAFGCTVCGLQFRMVR